MIIAEAGVNHNGNLETALRLVDEAACAGADAVKFQTFIAEAGVSKFAPKAEYQKRTMGNEESQLEMVKKLELDENAHRKLMQRCKQKDILFLSTPFDRGSIELLDQLGLEMIKIPSGEITNLPYLRKVGALKKKLILSTGMSTLKEIRVALRILESSGTPRSRITVLHCNTEYPTPYEDVNLLAMLTIRDKLGVKVGYSDHTLGVEVPIAAAALGASVIEKHFTLDRTMPGPDHIASIEPDELRQMVLAVRNIEKVLGDGTKKASPSEQKNIPIARKSIVADKDIAKGEIYSESNITIKRPGTGITPMQWDHVLGIPSKRNFCKDELIEL
ncbi:MAG: N-acetylneuraminate synthase [Candidatus Omnitrophica bacterium]|nr:N-acetylneuraminate synthase [Candidatus Omnitrophota bacterium]